MCEKTAGSTTLFLRDSSPGTTVWEIGKDARQQVKDDGETIVAEPAMHSETQTLSPGEKMTMFSK